MGWVLVRFEHKTAFHVRRASTTGSIGLTYMDSPETIFGPMSAPKVIPTRTHVRYHKAIGSRILTFVAGRRVASLRVADNFQKGISPSS